MIKISVMLLANCILSYPVHHVQTPESKDINYEYKKVEFNEALDFLDGILDGEKDTKISKKEFVNIKAEALLKWRKIKDPFNSMRLRKRFITMYGEEFNEQYDLDNDGFITRKDVLYKKGSPLRIELILPEDEKIGDQKTSMNKTWIMHEPRLLQMRGIGP